ncbi:SAV_915 family protein [Streptomyces scopuliridis]|uniref:SAV_915 family protein n=1 Tax=Streptomyces scopuliridis TaxID=452529 RepID=UPI0036AEFA7A
MLDRLPWEDTMERLVPEDADGGSDPAPAADPDADPDEPRTAGPLYVPVRLGSTGGHQLRFARTPLGTRTAIGFTSSLRLTAVLGEGQAWIRLAEPALRALAEPLGTTLVTVDPQLTAPATVRRPAPDRPCARRALELPEAMAV